MTTPWREVIPYDFNGLVADFDVGIVNETDEEIKQRNKEDEIKMKEIEDNIVSQRLMRKRQNEEKEDEEAIENKRNKESEEIPDSNNQIDEPI